MAVLACFYACNHSNAINNNLYNNNTNTIIAECSAVELLLPDLHSIARFWLIAPRRHKSRLQSAKLVLRTFFDNSICVLSTFNWSLLESWDEFWCRCLIRFAPLKSARVYGLWFSENWQRTNRNLLHISARFARQSNRAQRSQSINNATNNNKTDTCNALLARISVNNQNSKRQQKQTQIQNWSRFEVLLRVARSVCFLALAASVYCLRKTSCNLELIFAQLSILVSVDVLTLARWTSQNRTANQCALFDWSVHQKDAVWFIAQTWIRSWPQFVCFRRQLIVCRLTRRQTQVSFAGFEVRRQQTANKGRLIAVR